MEIDSAYNSTNDEDRRFCTSLKTKQNSLCQINWNGFFVKDENGIIKNICLLGAPIQLQSSIQSKKKPETSSQNYEEKGHNKLNKKQRSYVSHIPLPEQRQKKKTGLMQENTKNKVQYEDLPLYNASASLETVEKIVENTSKQVDDINKVIKDLSKKYDFITKRLVELEKKDKRLGKNHKNMGRHIKLLETGDKGAMGKNLPTLLEKHVPPNEQSSTEKKPSFFSDPFGYKRQHQDLLIKIQQVENRKKELELFEAQLLTERKTLNARIEEFCLWRDKLEQLETEIEKRRQELLKDDLILPKQAPVQTQTVITAKPEIRQSAVSETFDYHKILDNIPQSAAIIQRGILKQINNSFAELIGYPLDEIVERNFFDLIADEGLAELERYFLNRLKGENITSYKTVFLTKENEKVFVEVTVKPTTYNGEKAEITIITGLEK